VRLLLASGLLFFLTGNPAFAQFDEDQLGGWYT